MNSYFSTLANHVDVKGVDFAREMIESTARHTPDDKARLTLAKMASGRFGNYTPEAKQLWADYAAKGAPKWQDLV